MNYVKISLICSIMTSSLVWSMDEPDREVSRMVNKRPSLPCIVHYSGDGRSSSASGVLALEGQSPMSTTVTLARDVSPLQDLGKQRDLSPVLSIAAVPSPVVPSPLSPGMQQIEKNITGTIEKLSSITINRSHHKHPLVHPYLLQVVCLGREIDHLKKMLVAQEIDLYVLDDLETSFHNRVVGKLRSILPKDYYRAFEEQAVPQPGANDSILVLVADIKLKKEGKGAFDSSDDESDDEQKNCRQSNRFAVVSSKKVQNYLDA